jgi:hypothetical protein
MSQPVDTFTTQEQIDSYLNSLSKKYLANNVYVVSGTNTGYLTAGVTALTPYANFTNRYFPTVATKPEKRDNLKTKAELGGYFIPQNLGASTYLAKEITYTVMPSSGVVNNVIEPDKYNKGRGLTQNDQSEDTTHQVDNTWMKAANTSEVYDGNIINTAVYQKFFPYQSSYESIRSDSNGIVNSRFDYEYWTGPEKNIWNETSNENTKLDQFKYFDLEQRTQNLAYNPGYYLYSWNTDVYGNQYGLYKPIEAYPSMYNSLTATGYLWVKTIDGTASLAPSALNLVYKNYSYNSVIYNQLSNNNIINTEVFFDTLVTQLDSVVLYDKLAFNYNKYTIESSLQTFAPLYYNNTPSIAIETNFFNTLIGELSPDAVTLYGGNWYDTENKTITICTLVSSTFTGKTGSLIDTSGVSAIIVPVLYQLDLNNPTQRRRIYPTNTTTPETFLEYVYPPVTGSEDNEVAYLESPVFCYNKDTNLYSICFLTFTSFSQQTNLINYKVAAGL